MKRDKLKINCFILDPENELIYDFGDFFFKKNFKKVHDWPPMFASYSMSPKKI